MPLAAVQADETHDALIDALRQRAALLELILADLIGEQTIVRKGLLPAELAAHAGDHRDLSVYAAELMLCPDQLWRVSSETSIGRLHPAALASFLPALCRALLGETLRLASLPSRWLADPGALPAIVAQPHRWTILDALQRGPALRLAGMTPAQRIALHDRVCAAPWRYAARLLVEGRARRTAMVRISSGAWTTMVPFKID